MEHSYLEYFIVAASLVSTVAVGFYFSRGNSSLQDYMLGSRKMSILPISLSIVATYLSGASMVSTAQEVYLYGMHIWWMAVDHILHGIIFAYAILPVSYSVKSASTFEFFDRRFKNGLVRKYASVVFALETIFHTAISQYIPAASLSQATGLPVMPTVSVLSAISWVYTASGGFRAVTYADSYQAVLFIGVILLVFFIGVVEVGGFPSVLQKAKQGYRWEFANFNLDYSLRYSVPLLIVSSVYASVRCFLSPSFHQRVVAMPTYEDAKKVTIWSAILTGTCQMFTYLTGVVIYAYFAGCDPVLEGKNIKNHATILPYFVGEVSKSAPGLTGLFLSGVIAAGLSTTTSCWNTVACTIYEDIVSELLPQNISKKAALRIITFILFLVAVISTFCIYIILHIPSIIEATATLKSFAVGSTFSLYVCGMLLPWINAKGAMAGSFISAATTAFIAVTSQKAKLTGKLVHVPKVLTNAECIVNGTTYAFLNASTTNGFAEYGLFTAADPSVPWYEKLSFAIFPIPGTFLGLATAFLVSYMTGHEDLTKIDREMIIPSMRWVLPLPPPSNAAEEEPLKIDETCDK